MNSPQADSPNEVPLRRGVVAVVVRDGRLLVIRRSRHVVAPLAICFPGGGIEANETEPEALVREIREELATEVEPIRCLWRSVTPWNVALAWWLARLPPGTALTANPAEVEAIHWLLPEELLALADLLPSNREFLAAILRKEIAIEMTTDN
jgi:8-oxo-dGTP diphosphatase